MKIFKIKILFNKIRISTIKILQRIFNFNKIILNNNRCLHMNRIRLIHYINNKFNNLILNNKIKILKQPNKIINNKDQTYKIHKHLNKITPKITNLNNLLPTCKIINLNNNNKIFHKIKTDFHLNSNKLKTDLQHLYNLNFNNKVLNRPINNDHNINNKVPNRQISNNLKFSNKELNNKHLNKINKKV